jgi:hypothetical protein
MLTTPQVKGLGRLLHQHAQTVVAAGYALGSRPLDE